MSRDSATGAATASCSRVIVARPTTNGRLGDGDREKGISTEEMIDEWDHSDGRHHNETRTDAIGSTIATGRERGKFKTSYVFLFCASVVFFLAASVGHKKMMRRGTVDEKNAYSYNSIDRGCAFAGNKRVRCAREQPVAESELMCDVWSLASEIREVCAFSDGLVTYFRCLVILHSDVGAVHNRKREKKRPKEVVFVTNPARQPSEISIEPVKKPSKKDEMTIFGSNPARQPINVKPSKKPKKPDMVITYGRQPSTKPGSKPAGKKPSSRSRKPYSRSNTIPGRLSDRSATRKKTNKKKKKKDKKEKKRNSAPKRQRVPNHATR